MESTSYPRTWQVKLVDDQTYHCKLQYMKLLKHLLISIIMYSLKGKRDLNANELHSGAYITYGGDPDCIMNRI